jgi:hypothetical protein
VAKWRKAGSIVDLLSSTRDGNHRLLAIYNEALAAIVTRIEPMRFSRDALSQTCAQSEGCRLLFPRQGLATYTVSTASLSQPKQEITAKSRAQNSGPKIADKKGQKLSPQKRHSNCRKLNKTEALMRSLKIGFKVGPKRDFNSSSIIAARFIWVAGKCLKEVS